MKQFIGTKELRAEAMTLGKYNLYRSWVMPADEDPEAPGYLVVYPDGYESWSPQAAFDASYRSDGMFNFGHALYLLNQGKCVSRSGWNGKSMYLFKVNGSRFEVNRPPLSDIMEPGTMVNYHSHIDMKTADGTIVPWLCSQTDMAADDWGVIE